MKTNKRNIKQKPVWIKISSCSLRACGDCSVGIVGGRTKVSKPLPEMSSSYSQQHLYRRSESSMELEDPKGSECT